MKKVSLTKPDNVVKQVSLAQLKRIEAVYEKAYKEIQKIIDKQNLATFSGQMQRRNFEELKEKIWKEQEKVGKQIESILKYGMYDACEQAIEVSMGWLKEFGIELEGAFDYVPDEVIKSILTGQVYEQKWYLSKAIWNDVKRTQKDIEEIISTGLSMNLPSVDIAKDLEKYVNPSARKDYDWSRIYPGVKKKVDYNALRLSRTLISHAYQQTYQKTVSKNPFVEGVKWNIANNHRVCDICKQRATQNKYGLGKGIYPKDKVPMDHPNGQCVLTSYIPSSMIDISDRLADWAKGKKDNGIDDWMDEMFKNNKKAEEKKQKVKKDIIKNKKKK